MSEIDNSYQGASSSSNSVRSKLQRFTWTFRKWWWIVLITAGTGIAWEAWQDAKKPPLFISYARMMVGGQIALPQGRVWDEERGNWYGTQSRIMESKEVRQRATNRIESSRPELRPASVSISVSQEQGTSMFALTAIGDEPNYTKEFLDACMEEFIRYKNDLRAGDIAKVLTQVSSQLTQLKRDAEKAELELTEFQKKNNLTSEQEGNGATRKLVQLNETIENLKLDSKLLTNLDVEQNLERNQKATAANVEGSDEDADPDSAPSGLEENYFKVKHQLRAIKAERDRRSQFLRPKHPIIARLDAEIANQERAIQWLYDQAKRQIATRLEANRLRIETLEESVKEWRQKEAELSEKLANYATLKNKLEMTKAEHLQLVKSNEQISLAQRLGTDEVLKVMEYASPAVPTKQGLVKDLATGAMLGILIGLGVILLIGFLDDRITSATELRERFPEPMLGHIPNEPSGGRVSMLTLANKQGIFAESYRNLRSTLHFMSFENPRPKAFLITSAVPGEGKSTLAANLGITIAGGGARTLLIDADLRKGLLHTYFNLDAAPGLMEILSEEIDWKDAMVETSVKNLFLIPRGRGGVGPGELFLSNVADRLLREIYSGDFDRIIIDSAPVLATDDTACLAPKIDATLFVVRAEVSSMRLTRTALDTLQKRQVNILGLILNAANLRSSEYHYYQKYGDYYAEPATAKNA
jgi:capsular exopolysaccharide synthesis family protein